MKKLFSMVAAALLALFGLSAQAQEMTVRFFDMGKADAMLITAPSGEQILIDTGTNKGGKKLAERFAKDGVQVNLYMQMTDLYQCISTPSTQASLQMYTMLYFHHYTKVPDVFLHLPPASHLLLSLQ